jgi:hypothetical protein
MKPVCEESLVHRELHQIYIGETLHVWMLNIQNGVPGDVLASAFFCFDNFVKG